MMETESMMEKHPIQTQLAKTRRLALSPGFGASARAVTLLVATTSAIPLTANSDVLSVAQVAAFGLAIALIGLMFGSEALVGLATVPILLSALVGAESGSSLGFGRALIIGCLWYVSLELTWWALRQRTTAVRTTRIAEQRSREVATVVIVSLTIGLAATGLSSLAPTRTLFVRAIIATLVLVIMTLAVRHLGNVTSDQDV